MPVNDLAGLGLYLGYFVVFALPLVLLKGVFKTSFEVTRKLYHLAITLSIFPLVRFFNTWYMAVAAIFIFLIIVYPLLKMLEKTSLYQRFAVEREGGEFKRSFIVVQVSFALLLTVFWGILGSDWKCIAVVAVMAWGLGDAAAAIVGKAMGRRRIQHPWIREKKTFEGTLAMFITAGLAVFFTMLTEAGQPWHLSLAVAFLVAPVCATVELFTNRGMDTLTVPIATGLSVVWLMSLFSLLGG